MCEDLGIAKDVVSHLLGHTPAGLRGYADLRSFRTAGRGLASGILVTAVQNGVPWTIPPRDLFDEMYASLANRAGGRETQARLSRARG
jgi:hypothetical protein